MVKMGKMGIILALILVNTLSFAVMRQVCKPQTKLQVLRKAGSTEPTNYLLAGMMNQPEGAYEFLINELEGGIVLVKYDQWGFDPEEMMRSILLHAWNNYRNVVYTLSVSDHVGRRLERFLSEHDQIVAINPCPAREILNSNTLSLVTTVEPLLRAGCYLLGWLSVVPVVPTAGGPYSLMLIADQLSVMVHDENAGRETGRTVAVVQSSQDQFLASTTMDEFFDGIPIVVANAAHGDTVGAANEYYCAWKKVMELVPN